MTENTLTQAANACLQHHAVWLSRRETPCATEQTRQAAREYIRAHETVQTLSIRHWLSDFMHQHGAELTAILAPELIHIRSLPAYLQHRALDRATHHLCDALASWLAAGNEINHAQGCAVLNAVGVRPDAASRTDSQQK
ncbi:Polarity suppression protein [Kosakonia sp. SOY2]|uniref:phage polarity suppression protein n=1 Tax=Kosakonia sp. SOY2 TaxID=3014557 RepID=UPI0022AC163F|nr:phage polarity suppression protein [Kosakonia sp. SOY2]MCZ3384866.1 Polarity suppression protein [Kosakonia sp. SOY2]